MNNTWQQIIQLISNNQVRISAHGYDELAADNIAVRDMMVSVDTAVVVEDYPDYHKGPAVPMLHYHDAGNPIHVVWAFQKAKHLRLYW